MKIIALNGYMYVFLRVEDKQCFVSKQHKIFSNNRLWDWLN